MILRLHASTGRLMWCLGPVKHNDGLQVYLKLRFGAKLSVTV